MQEGLTVAHCPRLKGMPGSVAYIQCLAYALLIRVFVDDTLLYFH